MSLPGFSTRRPVLTVMATAVVALLGLVALERIQIDLLPNIELPTVTIQTEYPGASPEVMERLVTQIVEEIVATVPGVVELTSQSAQGSSTVRATFGWGTDIDTAALDVQSTMQDELEELPEEVNRPRIRKFDISSFPVVLLGISSTMDPVQLTEFVEDQVRPRFSRLPNVAQVDIWGGYPREVRVELDPERIQALNLPLDLVLDRLRAANLDLPAGILEDGRQQITLRAPGEFESLDEIRNTVVAVRDGAAITIGQIAKVQDTYERLTRIIRLNGQRGLRLAIRKQANANTVEVSRRILQEIDELNARFPQVEVVPVLNQGNFIERSIQNVARSVLYGGGLAVLVLLFFLLSLRSTLVISVAIPISILGTFAMLFFGGFTINLTTLGGLALGVGMMVDSSIVVLENIFRRRDEEGEAIDDAAVKGTQEVGTAILASTLTTLVVFLPLAFVRGISGLLLEELAYVVVFSLVCSLIVSLTLLPMLASRILRDETGAERPPSKWAVRARAILGRLEDGYARVLGAALAHPARTIGLALVAFVASAAAIPQLGSEFLPPSDEGEVRVRGEMETGTRLDLVDAQVRKMEAIVLPAVPEAESWVVSVGASGRRPEDGAQGEIQLSLPPATERDRSNVEIAADLRQRLEGQIPGMKLRVRAPQGSFILQRLLQTDDGITIEILGFELERLDALAARAAEIAEGVEGITDVEVSRREGVPQSEIRIDRAKVADVGLSVRDVAEALKTAVAGTQAGEYRSRGNSYRILVQLEDAQALDLDEVLDLTLMTGTGDSVALRNLVRAEPGRGPLIIERKDQQRIVTVSANVAGRDLGSVAEELRAKLNEIPRPSGYDVRLSGAFEEQERSFRELVLSLGLAVLLVYMVLASQYESLRDPLVVMLSVPLATVGVVGLLLATGTTLNIQSYLGCIMLGGIVVNNAILLVDQSATLMREGFEAKTAVTEAGRRRLRPILMTTSTTLLGLLPLAFGIGEGADAQAPLARAVIGGLLGSTPITLVLIPVVFMLVHRDRRPAR